MRKALFVLLVFVSLHGQAQNVAINNTGTAPDGSAMLDVQHSAKGFLLPRMTAAQRAGISSPATSLLVYQTDGTAGFYYNSGTPGAPVWIQIPSGLTAGWLTAGNGSTNSSVNFMGTTDAQPLVFKVNNIPSGRLSLSVEGNTFFGYNTAPLLTSGVGNSLYGRNAGAATTTGSYNTGVGFSSLNNNTTSFANTAVGAGSLQFNTTGGRNTAMGYNAMAGNTTGDFNVAVGVDALITNTTGFSNVAVGNGALYNNTTLMELVAVGELALYNNGVGATDPSHGRYNTAVGSKALQKNAIGYMNTGIGWGALRETTSGWGNTAVGMQSLILNTTGIQNTGTGVYSLFNNTNGSYNTAMGYYTLLENISGNYNTAVGYQALRDNKGDYSTAMGFGALSGGTSTAERNTGVGYAALTTNTTGRENTGLGFQSDVTSSALSNATALGARAKVDCSNCLVLGSVNGVGLSNSNVNVGIGVTNPQAALHVADVGDLNNPQLQVQSQNFFSDFARIRLKGVATTPWWDVAGYVSSTPSSAQLNFYFSTFGDVLSLRGNGNAVLYGVLTQTSDVRNKTNIQPLQGSLPALMQLNAYRYQWKETNRDQAVQIGLLAQEVEKVFPELVSKDEKGVLSVNYIGLVPVLLQSLKEQQQQIDELKAQVQALLKSK